MQLIIAEKPSVARDIARVLGIRAGGRHALEGRDCTITWCVGHLVELEEPASYDGRWKAWRLDTLPMLPARFLLRPAKGTADQFAAVRDLLRDRRFKEVINACDAGREGELIFRYVYELAACKLPIRRLWISSMTDEAIKDGFARLRPGHELEHLADAARCRSEADWLVGLNATRAVTVRHRTGPQSTLLSIGRVQTPTLAIVVEREKAIRDFKPRDYWQVRGAFETETGETFTALWTRERVTRFAALAAARDIVDRCDGHAGKQDPSGPIVEVLEQKKVREPAPLLFDLTSLQRTANRRFGLSAQDTLQAAQALYEKYKLLTYPRTDSRHLSRDMVGELPKLFAGLARYADYQTFAQPLREQPPSPGKRVFDDAKVQDHHAIVPTGKHVDLANLGRDERRIFDLVARRFLGVFYPDAVFALTEAVIRVGDAAIATPGAAPPIPAGAASDDERMLDKTPPPPDRFVARGRVRLEAGWQVVAGFGDDEPTGRGADKKDASTEVADEGGGRLPVISRGQRLDGKFETLTRKTKPPPRHNEASLLAAMETAGRHIEDDELRSAMKDSGLGTPATRASIIETLIRRSFIERRGKQLHATETGIALIEALPVSSLASPELTGTWEARLARIARGEDERALFMRDIAAYVRELVETIRRAPVERIPVTAQAAEAAPAARARAAAPRTREGGGGRKRRGGVEVPARAGAEPTRKPPSFKVDDLGCPRCRQGTLVTGKRGWGCSRWREGCQFVVWFERDGKRLTKAALKKALASPGAGSG